MDSNPEQEAQTRIDEFTKEYIALVDKYQVGFAVMPHYVPMDNKGTFVTALSMQVMDKKGAPTPSPLNSVIQER